MSHHLVAGFFRHLRTIFAMETLPVDPPAPPRRRRSLLAAVFAHEQLPLDPEQPGRGSSWLSSLFLPERIDRDPNRTRID